jgi:threonine aldolase
MDSVMVCLSKGLGAPVGSVLCGTRSFIDRAMRMRKLVGGGMRQVGIIAAAGIYALEHHVERLAEDHRNAERLAAGIDAIPGLTCTSHGKTDSVPTNLVYFTVDGVAAGNPALDASLLSNRLREHGILANPLGSADQMRMVTHLNINAADIEDTLVALQSVLHVT